MLAPIGETELAIKPGVSQAEEIDKEMDMVRGHHVVQDHQSIAPLGLQ